MRLFNKGLSVKEKRLTPIVVRSRAFCFECGLCCKNTEMILTCNDIAKIESLGYSRKKFAVKRDGYYFLRNIDNHCFFYDEERGICKIYRYRPLGCSVYPIVYDVDIGSFIVDDYCPLARLFANREIFEASQILKHILSLLKENKECVT